MANATDMLEAMIAYIETNPAQPAFSEEEVRAFSQVNGLALDMNRLKKALLTSQLALMIRSLEVNPEDATVSADEIRLFAKDNGMAVDDVYLRHLDERASSERLRAFEMMLHNMEVLPQSRAFSVPYVRAFAEKHDIPLDQGRFRTAAAQVAAARVTEILRSA
jgi:hypothetical protein